MCIGGEDVSLPIFRDGFVRICSIRGDVDGVAEMMEELPLVDIVVCKQQEKQTNKKAKRKRQLTFDTENGRRGVSSRVRV